MQNILLGLALTLSLSASAWSAPEVKAHEKKISSAKEWGDVSAHLKGKIPSNVVREFADFSRGIPFPASRRIKNTLVLTQNDGTKVSVVLKRDGMISLNGKEWKLRPLATVEEEVTRLALFLSGEKKAEAGFFGLVPAAQAGGAGGMGVAAAAYAGANAWKAEACGEEELSQDLVNDCPLMAVGMKPVLVKARKIEDPKLFLPVSLKCPAENRGTLELLSKNILGDTERVRISYKKNSPKMVALAVAEKDAGFEEWLRVDFTESADELDIRMASKVVQNYQSLKQDVCDGPKRERQRYYASLKANNTDLRQSASDENLIEQKSSMDAT